MRPVTWHQPHLTGANAVANAWVYHGLVQVARLGRWLGRASEAAALERKAAVLKTAFNTAFIAANGAVCDGLCREVAHTAVHSTFYALAFGLVDAAHAPAAWAYVKTRVDASPLGVPCGAYPVQFLLLALFSLERDHGTAAFDVLTATVSDLSRARSPPSHAPHA